jgi:hypothetical protein
MGIQACYLPIGFQREQSESHTFKTSNVCNWHDPEIQHRNYAALNQTLVTFAFLAECCVPTKQSHRRFYGSSDPDTRRSQLSGTLQIVTNSGGSSQANNCCHHSMA